MVSELTVTEMVSALARLSREGILRPDAVRRIRQDVMDRLDDGTYQRVELTRETHRRAEQLILELRRIPLRAADALHLALATSMRAPSLASFDSRLAVAARAVGLVTYPR
jgi:predicted nucleic acid-binding protein